MGLILEEYCNLNFTLHRFQGMKIYSLSSLFDDFSFFFFSRRKEGEEARDTEEHKIFSTIIEIINEIKVEL